MVAERTTEYLPGRAQGTFDREKARDTARHCETAPEIDRQTWAKTGLDAMAPRLRRLERRKNRGNGLARGKCVNPHIAAHRRTYPHLFAPKSAPNAPKSTLPAHEAHMLLEIKNSEVKNKKWADWAPALQSFSIGLTSE
jgi:hypothetical protein